MQVKLKVLTGSHEGKEIAVSSEKFLVGRSEVCQLRPKSESVSRKHCIIVLKDNRVLVQDLKSRNGTFVNDKRLPVDKAKVLKGGDELRIGKLLFEVVIEHGLQAAKKPEVADVGDAAARTVEAGSQDSRFEAVDVGDWLDEADQIDRVRKLSDPETRQFHLDQSVDSADSGDPSSDNKDSDGDSTDLSVSESTTAKKRPDKKKKQAPGKLPADMKKAMTDNSRDAADNALKRFFSGR
ncbi:FHA domain protein [Rubripirellula lacrimiformis]|uniref:FHA domain protein n=1 Tax=Rubripirellula lacrimiformis TaxID=1930273 RepID=A0A517N6F2_9BACT|nr:FHA domain-containing protein [Rubripirellula lacrimiformis]QDT02701.1 FHA domain protein [Rubripirellula lacrimiformis]